MTGIANIMIYFAIYAFMGWVMESLFCSMQEHQWVNRGFLSGFFCPIYGFGGVMILGIGQIVTAMGVSAAMAPWLCLVLSVLIVSALEYVTGEMLLRRFHRRWWDYSDMRFNLKGHVCLRFSLIWGVLAYVLLQLVHPWIGMHVAMVPMEVRLGFSFVLLIYFAVDSIKSAGGGAMISRLRGALGLVFRL